MKLTMDATFENGVFVPVATPALAEHDRVRLTIETVPQPNPEALAIIQKRRKNRFEFNEETIREIGNSPEFDLLDAP